MIHKKQIYMMLVGIILVGNSYSQEITKGEKITLKKGEIEMKGFVVSFFSGNFEISLYKEDDSIKSLNFSAKVSFIEISKETSVEELKEGLITQMRLEDADNFLVEITPINFDENGGELKLLINTKNGSQEEAFSIVKNDDNEFVMLLFEKDAYVEFESIDLILKGSIFNLSKIKIKNYKIK